MATSATQLYGRQVAESPESSEGMRLYIDLDVCRKAGCPACAAECSYYYHPGNNGVRSIVELATYYMVCRRCDAPHCVAACPVNALEQQLDKGKLLVRHPMRCISCKSCSHACPYGTIFPEHVPLLAHNCDFCEDRRNGTSEPLCVQTCPHGALALRGGVEALDEHTYWVGDNLIVHSTHWEQAKA